MTSQLTGETTTADSSRVAISGEVSLAADRGLFQIQRVDLRTPATSLQATGQFSYQGDSNLQIALNSSDATELQAVLLSSGLLPDVEEQLRSYGVDLAGQLAFNGTLRGKLETPDIDGRVSLSSLVINGNDVGALTAGIQMTPAELRIEDGRLTEKDGGGMQFTVIAPRTGEDNATVPATLDRVNAAALLAVLPLGRGFSRETPGHSS